jgi:hypothetical protein
MHVYSALIYIQFRREPGCHPAFGRFFAVKADGKNFISRFVFDITWIVPFRYRLKAAA